MAEPPATEKWTEEDEARLADLKSMEIDMADKALGRLKATQKRLLVATMEQLTKQERDDVQARLDFIDNTGGDAGGGTGVEVGDGVAGGT